VNTPPTLSIKQLDPVFFAATASLARQLCGHLTCDNAPLVAFVTQLRYEVDCASSRGPGAPQTKSAAHCMRRSKASFPGRVVKFKSL
jgi:hypothetical protein